jgi:hypothetical protein
MKIYQIEILEPKANKLLEVLANLKLIKMEEIKTEEKQKGKKKRMPGGLKGKVTTPDDFNAPLDDLKDYM